MSQLRAILMCIVAFGILALWTNPRSQGQDKPDASPAAKAKAGALQLLQDKKWKEAAAAYEALAKDNPKSGEAWFRLAYAIHMSGDYQKAKDAHKKAAEFPAFRGPSLYNLTCAHARLGEKDAAFAAFNRALAAGFLNKPLMVKDDDLDSLHDDPRWQKSLASLDERINLYGVFDFWVGEWDVFDPKGKQVGSSKVERLEAGHLIYENWTGAQGGTGKSMSFVDPIDKRWKQVWVAQNGWIIHYDGEFKDGAMRFEGTSLQKNGSKEFSRCTFSPLPEGRVRQLIERSPNGKDWKTLFDGTYVPKKISD